MFWIYNKCIIVVSIPQAVSTVATMVECILSKFHTDSFNTASGKYCCNAVPTTKLERKMLKVSIPQAVSTVATINKNIERLSYLMRFNTASGKYCCNWIIHVHSVRRMPQVSIPQAVSTVATGRTMVDRSWPSSLWVSIPQAVSTVATSHLLLLMPGRSFRFNTASGKYCCNIDKFSLIHLLLLLSFNTASGKYCCNSSWRIGLCDRF